MNEIDKCGGRSFEQKKTVIQEMKTLMRIHNLIDTRSCKHPNKQAFTCDETVYTLGVYFSYDEELATKRNFFEKLPKLKKILNIWSSRDISIYGRVNIVKTLAISKLTFVCSVLDTPKGFTDEVNNIMFDYIWKYKNPKLKKNHYHQK